MSLEQPQSINDLRRYSKWDGQPKYFTNECFKCEGYRALIDGEICNLGVRWKILSREKTLSTCSLRKLVAKRQEEENVPKHPVLVYTPKWMDFVDGTLDWLDQEGWKTELVQTDAAHERGSIVVEWRK